MLTQAFAVKELEVNGKNIDTSSINLGFNFILFSSLGYLGTVLALRTNQDDFSVVIPFIRFRQENLRARPVVCSIDVFIDGRLPKLIESGFVSRNLILPPSIITQLQALSESSNSTKSLQGKRGIEVLNSLKSNNFVNISTHQFDSTRISEDLFSESILTCKQSNARLLTSNEKLAQLAQIEDVKVLNIKTLTQATQPEIVIGQTLDLVLIKEGKETHQAVGYLTDGSMIVVNQAVKLIGTSQSVTVASSINTSAGTMVFAELN